MTVYVAAISGGVDSVSLLDMLAAAKDHEIIVAHFDHGIREDSAEDAAFVGELAAKYGFAFETSREELGPGASEDRARTRRYAFLRDVAKKHNARIVTAHHSDDIVETVAINFIRGTGWRGLAVLDSDIVRPLLKFTKNELIKYAEDHGLTWREDSTNASDAYLRNRIRRRASGLDLEAKRQVLALRSQQAETKRQIELELKTLVGEGPEYSRYLFTHMPTKVAVECLRYVTDGKLTRPQLEKVLLAVKTAAPKAKLQAGSGITIHFSTRNFSLSLLK
jgi:tRNA(Ile)-lysidine synthase